MEHRPPARLAVPSDCIHRSGAGADVHDAGHPSPAAITLAWLVRLRWGAVVGQAATIAVASIGLRLDLPLIPLTVLVAATALSNVVLTKWLRRVVDVSETTAGIVLASDTLALTGLLYFSGGPANPFSVLYLVHVTLAALVLGFRWATGVLVVSAASYAMLFFRHVPVLALEHVHHGGGALSIHLQGMWIAFTVAASLIAYFVARVAAELRTREAELANARRLTARAEKLASLTTLAAGAAHELGTPLATIAVASKELEHSIRMTPDEALEDVGLIRREVERCRTILQRMSARAGDMMGELPEQVTASAVLTRCSERLVSTAANTVVDTAGGVAFLVCPVEGLVQVLLNLVQNGIDATRESGGRVRLASDTTAETVRFVVVDDGAGIHPEHRARVGEPFFTTKPPGQGMGLGIFLANAFAESCGGTLLFEETDHPGTRVILELPRTRETVDG